MSREVTACDGMARRHCAVLWHSVAHLLLLSSDFPMAVIWEDWAGEPQRDVEFHDGHPTEKEWIVSRTSG